MDIQLQNLIDFKLLTEQVDFCEEQNTFSTCRICLEKSDASKYMFNIFEGNHPIFTTIMSCASVQIMQGDGLPNTICDKCLTKLNVAWEFKLQCESSDSRLRQYYSPVIPSDFHMPESISSFEILKQDVTKALFNDLSNEDGHNQTTFQDPTVFLNDNNNIQNSTCMANNKSPKEPKDKEKHVAKIYQCETCGKVFSKKDYLIQHIRIHTGEKPYCCHLCDKRFINSGHLTTHMRTHTGEKPHACSLCPKMFSTRQDLQKHLMVHKGEKPFVCVTCNKRFGSSSNLYSHQRHHTGEKKFTCEHCQKAFYTRNERKQHLVVHTGEKAFLCEVCNKRFSQRAHLKRHSRIHVLQDVKVSLVKYEK